MNIKNFIYCNMTRTVFHYFFSKYAYINLLNFVYHIWKKDVFLWLVIPAPIAQLVECPLRGTGGHGFDPGARHTKVVKNGTSCSSLCTQIYGIELGLVDPVSG